MKPTGKLVLGWERGRGALGAGIRYATYAPVAHVFAIAIGTLWESAAPHGVESWDTPEEVARRLHGCVWRATLLCRPEQEEAFAMWASERLGAGYDFTAMTRYLLRRTWPAVPDDRWMCSEFIAEGLVAAGVLTLPPGVSTSRIDPFELACIVYALGAHWE